MFAAASGERGDAHAAVRRVLAAFAGIVIAAAAAGRPVGAAGEPTSSPPSLIDQMTSVSASDLAELPKPDWLSGVLGAAAPAYRRTPAVCEGDTFARGFMNDLGWQPGALRVHRYNGGDFYAASVPNPPPANEILVLSAAKMQALRTLLLYDFKEDQALKSAGKLYRDAAVSVFAPVIWDAVAMADLTAALAASASEFGLVSGKSIGLFVIKKLASSGDDGSYNAMIAKITAVTTGKTFAFRVLTVIPGTKGIDYVRLGYFLFNGREDFMELGKCYYAKDSP
jgi:hypothetical protein